MPVPRLGGLARVNTKTTYISKDGLDKLRAELAEMTASQAEIAQRIYDAKEHGDLSENAEYEDAKNEQAFVEGRIQTLETMIKNASLIDEHTSTDHVQIGSTVKVKGDDGTETFSIVGSARPNRPTAGSRTSRPWAAHCSAARRVTRSSSRFPPAISPTRSSRSSRPPPTPRRRSSGRQLQREARTVDWADELAASVEGPQVVNDSKTPSGTVHVGSLRGPAILDVITRALRARGLETTLLYGVDDMDSMDAQALLTPDAVDRYMGAPLAHIPDQAGDCRTRRMPVTTPRPSSTSSRVSASTRTATTG